MLYAWFDMESDAGSAARATCLSISGVLTNREFQVLEEFTFKGRLRKSRAPEVDAMMAHGMDIDTIQNEKDSANQLVYKLEKKFKEWASKGAIFVGYNNQNYDTIALSNLLFCNLRFPYIMNGKQRAPEFDLLPAVRAASVFAKNSLGFQLNEKGNISYKLQSMISINNIKTNAAHDSLEDTRATKELGFLLSKKAPEVFKSALALRNKYDVKPAIQNSIFCWHEAWREAKIFCGAFFGDSIYQNWYLLWDLKEPVENILNIADNRVELAKWIARPGKIIRTLKGNKAPIIMPKEYALENEIYREIGMGKLEQRYQALKKHRDQLSAKVRDIMQEKNEEKKSFDQTKKEPEEKIYSLKPSNEERKIMEAFSEAETLNDKKLLFNKFKSDDLKILAEMKLYEDHDKDEFFKILSPNHFKRLEKRIAKHLLDTSDTHSAFTKIPEQLSRLDTLKLQADSDKDDKKLAQLQKLDSYLVGMMNHFEAAL